MEPITFMEKDVLLTSDLIRQAQADKAMLYVRAGISVEVTPAKVLKAIAEEASHNALCNVSRQHKDSKIIFVQINHAA
jgi:hypothetical protein